jgi:hypothetical protein
MKLINPLIIVLLLTTCVACSKEDTKTQSEPAAQKTETGIIRTETNRIDSAKKALDDAGQVNQIIQDSADEQRETIEKTQQ